MPPAAESWLSPVLRRYLDLQQALGRGFANERRVLETFAAVVARTGAAALTPGVFATWCHTQTHVTPGVRRSRMRIVRNFCLYHRRTAPQGFVPDPASFPHPHQPVRPHLFSDAEILRLLAATGALRPVARCPLRRPFFRVALILLATTGIRRGELLRLTVQDYDPQTATLAIRASKFHKSRLLPLAADASQALATHLAARPPARRRPEAPLLWNGYADGRTYTASGLTDGLQELLRLTGIRTADGRWPRVHDYRHAFALRVLLRWYAAGVDLHAKLPLLATYLGHVSLASTEYYLPFIPELARAASSRFGDRYGALVEPLALGGGSCMLPRPMPSPAPCGPSSAIICPPSVA
jgi:integrase